MRVIPNITPIPNYNPSFTELSKLMRINADIIMKEISDHVDKEIERLKKEKYEVFMKIKEEDCDSSTDLLPKSNELVGKNAPKDAEC